MNSTSRYPVPPGGTIGILGGGQLGRMLALAAARLALKTHIYSDAADAPAFDVAPERTCAKYNDEGSLAAFAQRVDAITFEFENVPSATLAILTQEKPTYPGEQCLAPAQDRLTEKDFLSGLGIPTTAYRPFQTWEEAREALARVGIPAILKTRRFGYDGKGQWAIAGANDLEVAFAGLNGAPAILERRVDFSFECSVIAARSRDGVFAPYDLPQNIHGEQILRRAVVPAPLTARKAEEAKAIVAHIAEALDYVGVLAVEFFVTRDSSLLVNEIAPRVHNSGHWTLEACVVSQFEQHIRAIAGWPLGDPSRHSDAVMENLIGVEAEAWKTLAREPGALHLYGKTEVRPGRKMGHVTRLLPLTPAEFLRDDQD
ncbi:MAG TPA: 5-(carboxyamino)imidazole ribonucleotide synthase [Rhizomicrobium sp.]|jgi:5-(carboxyamino)imidazole ribonucleotide synthase|nr:5-(carboxyamino)imidazole ribonucleotide synthase [Rhizomicrobium sp.]